MVISEQSQENFIRGYLLIPLHQLQSLTFDVVLTADNVRKNWWQSPAFELGRGYLDIELPCILVLQIERYVVLLCE